MAPFKTGDLVVDVGHRYPGVGLVIETKKADYCDQTLVVWAYWPDRGIQRNSTGEPWFQWEVISESR